MESGEENIEDWNWAPKRYINAVYITITTLLMAVRIYHGHTNPLPFEFQPMARIGLLTLVVCWLQSTGLVFKTMGAIWDMETACDAMVRVNSVHFALLHTCLLCFFVCRLDIVQSPITFWWDRKRRIYYTTKYSFLLIGFVNPIIVGVLLRGHYDTKLREAGDAANGVSAFTNANAVHLCSWHFSFAARTVIPTGMLFQEIVYIAVLVLFIRPIRQILSILESAALRQILAQTSFWNSMIIILEFCLLVLTAVLINFSPAGLFRHEMIVFVGQLDVFLIMLCIVLCLRPAKVHEVKTSEDKIIDKITARRPGASGDWGHISSREPSPYSQAIKAPRMGKRKSKKTRSLGPFALKEALEALATGSISKSNAFTSLVGNCKVPNGRFNSSSRFSQHGSRSVLRIVPERASISESTSRNETTADTTPSTTSQTTSKTSSKSDSSEGWKPQFPDVYQKVQSESFGGYGKVNDWLYGAELPETFMMGRPCYRPGEKFPIYDPESSTPESKEMEHNSRDRAQIELEAFLNSSTTPREEKLAPPSPGEGEPAFEPSSLPLPPSNRAVTATTVTTFSASDRTSPPQSIRSTGQYTPDKGKITPPSEKDFSGSVSSVELTDVLKRLPPLDSEVRNQTEENGVRLTVL